MDRGSKPAIPGLNFADEGLKQPSKKKKKKNKKKQNTEENNTKAVKDTDSVNSQQEATRGGDSPAKDYNHQETAIPRVKKDTTEVEAEEGPYKSDTLTAKNSQIIEEGKESSQANLSGNQESNAVDNWERLDDNPEQVIADAKAQSGTPISPQNSDQTNANFVEENIKDLSLEENNVVNNVEDSAFLSPDKHSGEQEDMSGKFQSRDRSRSGTRADTSKYQADPFEVGSDRDRKQRNERGNSDRSYQKQDHDDSRQGEGGRSKKKKKSKQQGHGMTFGTSGNAIPGLSIGNQQNVGPSQQNRFSHQRTHRPHGSEAPDQHREIANQMSFAIKNPRAANLEECEGYVYAACLAQHLGILEQDVSMIARKFDSEFELYTDNFNNLNIRMKRSRRRDDDPDFILSKKLSSLLRHRAEDKGFKLLDGGFLFVDDILRRGEFRDFDEAAVKRVVRNNDKQRFKLETDEKTKKLKIRANQGHSMKVDNLELRTITGKDVPMCVHGTSYEAWKMIQSTGLKTMGRNHIHCAPGEPGESGVISGMRASCQLLVYIDMDKAIADGIKFEMSANKVILSEGDKTNTIAPKYFKAVKDRKTRKLLFRPQDDTAKKTDSSNAGAASSKAANTNKDDGQQNQPNIQQSCDSTAGSSTS